MRKEIFPSHKQARPCKYQNLFKSKEEPFTEKLPESIDSSKFVSHRARISGEFNSRKDLHSTKLEQNLIEIQIYLIYILSAIWPFHSFKKPFHSFKKRSKSVVTNGI